ncbi:MAG: hypothetical protein KDD61_04210 [Bdellovibrionales bacterium]|nr:hypothetical protein [Bdellovibrionales bacterium]
MRKEALDLSAENVKPIRLDMILYRYVFLTFIFSILIGCNDDNRLRGSLFGSTGPSGPSNSYSLAKPSKERANSFETFTIQLSYLSGERTLETAHLETVTTGNVSCSDPIVTDISGLNPVLTLSNCLGDGRVKVKYGSFESEEVLIVNSFEDPLISADAIAVSKDGKKAYVSVLSTILEVELSTGKRKVIASSTVGSGPSLFTITKINVGPNPDVIYCLASSASVGLMELNVLTGDRTTVASSGVGSGVSFNGISDFVLNESGTKAYVVSTSSDALILVDLVSQVRTYLSHSSVGLGDNFSYPSTIAMVPSSTKAYVYDRSLQALFQVDLATGNRIIVSRNSVHPGIGFQFTTYDIDVDADEKFAYSLDSVNGVLRVNLQTGARVLFSTNGVGNGMNFYDPRGMSFNYQKSIGYVIGSSLNQFELDSGNRVLLSDVRAGAGPNIKSVTDIDVYSILDNTAIVFDYLLGTFLSVDLSNGSRNEIVPLVSGTNMPELNVSSMEMSSDNQYLYVESNFSVYRQNMTTGIREHISGTDFVTSTIRGPGIALDSLGANSVDIELDSGDGTLFYATTNYIIKIDIASGARTELSSMSAGSGPQLNSMRDVVIADTDSQLFVLDDLGVFSVNANTGSRSEISGMIAGSGDPWSGPVLKMTKPDGDSEVFVLASSGDQILEVSLSTGARSIVTSLIVGTGDPLTGAVDIAVNGLATTLYVLQNNGEIVVVDRGTGNRTKLPMTVTGQFINLFSATFEFSRDFSKLLISDMQSVYESDVSQGKFRTIYSPYHSSGNLAFSDNAKIEYDSINHKAYGLVGGVFTVDLNSGVSSVVSDHYTGTGPRFYMPKDLVINSNKDTLFVSDFEIVSVDIPTGNRTLVSGVSKGAGPELMKPEGIFLNQLETDLYIVDSYLNALIRINILTGDRTIVSDSGTGLGPNLSYPNGVVLNSSESEAYVSLSVIPTQVIAVDLSTGDRRYLTNANGSVGAGTGGTGCSSVILLSGALNCTSSSSGLLQINETNGDRVIKAR